MSSNSTDTDVAAFVALYASLRLADYCTVAATALLIYDTLLTFSREVNWFWTGRMTGARVLFFANRYFSLCLFVLGLIDFAPFSDKIRESIKLSSINPISWNSCQDTLVFSALRAFVLSKNKYLSICVLILGLAPVGINLSNDPWCTYQYSQRQETVTGCNSGAKWYYILYSVFILEQSPQSVLLCLNVGHLSFSLAKIFSNGSLNSDISAFTSLFATILTSHFLLDLQEAYQQTVRVDSDDILNLESSSNTPSFVDRMIGSIGSEIHFAKPEDEDDHATCTDLEDSRGDRMDIQGIHSSDTDGHLGDEETARTGIIGSNSSVIDSVRQEREQEQDGSGRAEAAWEDSKTLLVDIDPVQTSPAILRRQTVTEVSHHSAFGVREGDHQPDEWDEIEQQCCHPESTHETTRNVNYAAFDSPTILKAQTHAVYFTLGKRRTLGL
ncbi:hypothetical protein C8Q74DRAFT_1436465 [Fomes fomentarius]|nr:hypothetical protein C8Q74DRAFT_1436465 [Fomes fomentarius]